MIQKKSVKIILIICAAALMIGAAAFLAGADSSSVIIKNNGRDTYTLDSKMAFGLANTDQVVESIRQGLKGRSRSISISVTFQGEYIDDISSFVNELMEFAMEHTGIPDEGDYIRYQMGGYTFSYGCSAEESGYRYDITIVPQYYTLLKEEKEVDEKIDAVISEFDLPDDASDYDRVLAVYDYLADNVPYDFVHKNNEGYHKKSTAYGALVNKRACCQGYAVTMYRLLLELGVDCRVITGQGISEDGVEMHSWNIVRIDGKYYNIDPTWNRNLVDEDYFLKSDQDFADHIRQEKFESDEFRNNYPMAAESLDPS